MDKKITVTTVRIPRDIWLKLRRMQEEGTIVSINDAVIRGLVLITAEAKED